MSFLISNQKKECFGCEACVQICEACALSMVEDEEGFRYPALDHKKCVACGLCRTVCPYPDSPLPSHEILEAFGGHHRDREIQKESTSGGAFTALVDAWCTDNYGIFGATQEGCSVFHTCVTDKSEIYRFRKSKYTQSVMGTSYAEVKKLLACGKKVVFSGTPCQVAGLQSYLKGEHCEGLLTIEVLCEGVPSPWYLKKFDTYLRERFGCGIRTLDYRNKDKPRWDFSVMRVELENGKSVYIDRWFNPFSTFWIGGLMSRPSCYGCPYTGSTGTADITLGDLWGVHIHCPELYDKNRGVSLILCHTEKGMAALSMAQAALDGHALDPAAVMSYQKRLRMSVSANPQREAFMGDLISMDYKNIYRKWAKGPSIKLLWQKYVWGNRQKIGLWNLIHSRR